MVPKPSLLSSPTTVMSEALEVRPLPAWIPEYSVDQSPLLTTGRYTPWVRNHPWVKLHCKINSPILNTAQNWTHVIPNKQENLYPLLYLMMYGVCYFPRADFLKDHCSPTSLHLQILICIISTSIISHHSRTTEWRQEDHFLKEKGQCWLCKCLLQMHRTARPKQ